MAKQKILASLDIGTTKTCAVVVEIKDNGKPEIVGIGEAPCEGLKKGMVIDIESTVSSIKTAIEAAEAMAGCQVNSVYAGIAGSHIKGKSNTGVVAIKGHEVEGVDINRAIEAAKVIPLSPDEHVLHVIVQDFKLDGQGGIKTPLGISGDRLEVEVFVITASGSSVRNIEKCISKAGFDVIEIILQPLASSIAVLTQEEKDLGVIMVDIGGGTMDIALHDKSNIRHTSVVGIGGNHLTSDIAIGLRTPFKEAEKIKIEYGCLSAAPSNGEDIRIDVPMAGGGNSRVVSKHVLTSIVEPRVEEIMFLISDEIKKARSGCMFASGVVFTGGTSQLQGLVEMGEAMLGIPVRIGMPECNGKLGEIVKNPIYSTAVGIVDYVLKDRDSHKSRKRSKVMATLESVESWFRDYF